MNSKQKLIQPTYTPPFDYDNNIFEKMDITKREWHDNLCLLRCSCFDDYFSLSESEIELFTRYLLEVQRTDVSERKFWGCWSLPCDTGMPSDARVDFIYFPTYTAVSWLTLVKMGWPHIAKLIKEFDLALARGLTAASGRNLKGHGYDGDIEMIKAIETLSLGKVFSFINESPRVSPLFKKAVDSAKGRIQELLSSRDGRSWGYVPSYKLRRALALLDGDDDKCLPVCFSVINKLSEKILNDLCQNVSEFIWNDFFTKRKNKILENELDSRIDELTNIANQIVPKYNVFRRNGRVASAKITGLSIDYDLVAGIEWAIAEMGDLPIWIGEISRDYLVDRVLSNLNNKLPVSVTFGKGRMSMPATISLSSIDEYRYNYEKDRGELLCSVQMAVARGNKCEQ